MNINLPKNYIPGMLKLLQEYLLEKNLQLFEFGAMDNVVAKMIQYKILSSKNGTIIFINKYP